MTNWVFAVFLLIGLCSCNEKKPIAKSYFNVDSLMNVQLVQLTAKAASVTKRIKINDLEETVKIKPDSALWAHELAIFKHLDILNKPIYATAYEVIDGTKDSNSNLTLRIYHAKREVPVTVFKLYYQDSFDKLRRIEATSEESNALYFTTRKFVLTFDDLAGGIVLQRYAVEGFQKMILSDTVRFSLHSEILY